MQGVHLTNEPTGVDSKTDAVDESVVNSPRSRNQRRKKPKSKRSRSRDHSPSGAQAMHKGSVADPKKKKLQRVDNVSDDCEDSNASSVETDEEEVVNKSVKTAKPTISLPAETFGKLLEILRDDLKSVSLQITDVDRKAGDAKEDVKRITTKLAKVERINDDLRSENEALKEKLLDVEYRQQCNNLLFEGISDAYKESDAECARKLRFTLKKHFWS